MSKKTDHELKRLRRKIDQADKDLLRAFSDRFAAVEKVGKLKKKLKIPVVQKARWKELLVDRLERAKHLRLSDSFVKVIFKAIHLEAIRIQKRKN